MNNEHNSRGDGEARSNLEVFQKAIDWFGGQSEMALAIGMAQPTISLIKLGKRHISLELALSVQRLTNDAILASDLRPDKKDELTRAR